MLCQECSGFSSNVSCAGKWPIGMFDAVTLRPQCGHRGSISRGCPVPAPQVDDQDPRHQQRHADADRFDVLSERVAACEDRHRRIEAWLEFGGMERSRLDDLSGSRSRASEIMHKRPAFSLAMIGKLHEDPAILAEVLIQPYHLETGK